MLPTRRLLPLLLLPVPLLALATWLPVAGALAALAWLAALAARLGIPRAARAVGVANAQNPVAVAVPCHRVVGADGTLTGYAGGLERKRWLLAHESTRLPLFAAGARRDDSFTG
jgi:O-6-methylguanine DNA methyltransferase